DVAHYKIELFTLCECAGRFRRLRRLGSPTLFLKDLAQQLARRPIVVNDKNLFHSLLVSSCLTFSCSNSSRFNLRSSPTTECAGRLIRKVVPRSRAVLNDRRPPCSFTTCCTIANPNPVPRPRSLVV